MSSVPTLQQLSEHTQHTPSHEECFKEVRGNHVQIMFGGFSEKCQANPWIWIKVARWKDVKGLARIGQALNQDLGCG